MWAVEGGEAEAGPAVGARKRGKGRTGKISPRTAQPPRSVNGDGAKTKGFAKFDEKGMLFTLRGASIVLLRVVCYSHARARARVGPRRRASRGCAVQKRAARGGFGA